jgi:hypothetical protein
VNRIDKIIALAEKKPIIAFLMGCLVAVGALAGVIVYQNNKINNQEEEKYEALRIQATEFRLEIKEKNIELVAARKETNDCRDQVVSRTDLFVDRITQGYQKQIDEAKQIEKERAKLFRERSSYIIKDQKNLNELNKTVQ